MTPALTGFRLLAPVIPSLQARDVQPFRAWPRRDL
jgi:hypothetical protein